jgi:hypothetical protein
VGAVALLAISLAARALAAQSGRLEGTLRDTLRSPLGATVEATRLAPEPVLQFQAHADERGRFHFDSLPPGEYALHVGTPLLDSLELSLPDRALTIATAQTAHADIALPGGASLRDALCPGVELGPGKGVVAGHASDADSGEPLVGATVVVSWNELVVDRVTLKATTEERVASGTTRARGEYRLCGVPTDVMISLQLQRGDTASAEVRITVPDVEGAIVRDLSMSFGRTPEIATGDATAVPGDSASARGDSATAPRRAGAVVPRRIVRTGAAGLTGIVRGAGGQPLANTELRIEGMRSTSMSGADGRYALSGLPAGTQMLVARHIGYEVLETPVELRAGKSLARDIQLARVVSLDSMRVVAMRAQYPEFEWNRRSNPTGVFLGPEQIEQRKKLGETVDLLSGIPRVTVSGHGSEARATSARGRSGARDCDGMRILLNGALQLETMNDVSASEVGAIEIYPQGELAPAAYSVRGSCGVVVLWTKQSRRRAAPPAGKSATEHARPPRSP